MSYERVNYKHTNSVANSTYFLREALGCKRLCFNVVDCDPGWSASSHDHLADNYEEVYYLVDGAMTVTVEGDTLELRPGDAVRVEPHETRYIENGDTPSTLVIAGAEIV